MMSCPCAFRCVQRSPYASRWVISADARSWRPKDPLNPRISLTPEVWVCRFVSGNEHVCCLFGYTKRSFRGAAPTVTELLSAPVNAARRPAPLGLISALAFQKTVLLTWYFRIWQPDNTLSWPQMTPAWVGWRGRLSPGGPHHLTPEEQAAVDGRGYKSMSSINQIKRRD